MRSGTIARRYLSLDQAMVMGAIGNVLADNVIRRAFSTRDVEQALRPVIGMEEFGAGIASPGPSAPAPLSPGHAPERPQADRHD